jgi:hypothetical protein
MKTLFFVLTLLFTANSYAEAKIDSISCEPFYNSVNKFSSNTISKETANFSENEPSGQALVKVKIIQANGFIGYLRITAFLGNKKIQHQDIQLAFGGDTYYHLFVLNQDPVDVTIKAELFDTPSDMSKHGKVLSVVKQKLLTWSGD